MGHCPICNKLLMHDDIGDSFDSANHLRDCRAIARGPDDRTGVVCACGTYIQTWTQLWEHWRGVTDFQSHVVLRTLQEMP